MTRLDINKQATPEPKRRDWSLVVTILLAIVGWLFAATAGAFGDYRKLGDRVTTLETQRVEDVRTREQQRTDDTRWRERIENKIDAILQRGKS
jgi:hypothetical protein